MLRSANGPKPAAAGPVGVISRSRTTRPGTVSRAAKTDVSVVAGVAARTQPTKTSLPVDSAIGARSSSVVLAETVTAAAPGAPVPFEVVARIQTSRSPVVPSTTL